MALWKYIAGALSFRLASRATRLRPERAELRESSSSLGVSREYLGVTHWRDESRTFRYTKILKRVGRADAHAEPTAGPAHGGAAPTGHDRSTSSRRAPHRDRGKGAARRCLSGVKAAQLDAKAK